MKRILILIVFAFASITAFAQEPAPISPTKLLTNEFYIKVVSGDTIVYQYKGGIYGWHRVGKYSDLVTKTDKATTITINGVTYDLSSNREWTIPTTDTTSLSARIDAKISYSGGSISDIAGLQDSLSNKYSKSDADAKFVPKTTTVNGQALSGNISLDKDDIGLGNVDNTSDASKPISTATQTALNGKQATLVSGSNIKTINGESLLGSGNVTTPSTDTTSLSNRVNLKADKSIVITAGTGLVGGGNLSTGRTLSVDTAEIRTVANSRSLSQAKTADDLKANVGGSNATGTWGIGITGNAATATTATTAGTVTTAAQPAITSVGTLSGLTVTAPIAGSVTGNSATSTALQTPRTIAGVSFDGTSNISLNNNAITNGAGYLTSINYGNVTTALGYTPYNPATYPVTTGGETLQSVTDRGAYTTAYITVGDIYAGNIGVGRIRISGGDASNTGYISFFKSNNDITGYIGYNGSNIDYQAENGANHLFKGGDIVAENNITALTFIGNLNGTASAAPWSGITGKPTFLSQFTNDLGNYGSWITASALSPYQLSSGLGSNAYTSTAYLPLTGGALSGSTSGASSVLSIFNSSTGYIADFRNAAGTVARVDNSGNITGSSFVKWGGTSSQFLKANGGIDNNSYVVANSAITGATKAKITYDSKGLVTAGADLIESDIPALPIAKTTGLQGVLDLKANDNDVVDISNNQTITGSKTLSGYTTLSGGTDIKVPLALTSASYPGSTNLFTIATVSRNVSFPDAAGMLALTSDIPVSSSGTYTPTVTNIYGVTFIIAGNAMYIRSGDIVSVSGSFSGTFSTFSDVEISLPIASTMVAGDLAGVPSGLNITGYLAVPNTPNGKARISVQAGTTGTSLTLAYSFQYKVTP